MTLTDLAVQNLASPMVLFFVLGLIAAFARSDLSVPESVAKFLAGSSQLAKGMCIETTIRWCAGTCRSSFSTNASCRGPIQPR